MSSQEANHGDIPQKFWSNAQTTAQFCEEVYPNLSSIVSKGIETEDTDWHQWLIDRAIICPTNQDVDQINSLMIKNLPGEMHTYKSHNVERLAVHLKRRRDNHI